MKRIYFVIVAVVFALSFLGCDLLPSFRKVSPPTTPVIGPTSPILVKINDWVLTIDEFDQQVDMLIKLNGGNTKIPVQALGVLAGTFLSPQVERIDLSSPETKKIYLELMINQELLAQEAKLRGLDRDPEVVKGIRKSTVEILGFSLLKNTLKDINVTPIEVEDLYNNDYKRTLESIERRKIREIVVDSESKAKDLLIQLLSGSNFNELASQHSLTESAAAGGLLKHNDQEYLVRQPGLKFPKFWEVAFSLDKDGTSSVFKDPVKEEYYILKVDDVQKGVPQSLDEVYNELEYILLQNKSMDSIGQLMGAVRSRFEPNTVINSGLIN
ncbi:MAG: peptidyl-prolyl cis-trans isomerase [Candidatus Omnitrophota bacterium]